MFRTERGALTLTTLTLAYSHAVWAEFCAEGRGPGGGAGAGQVLEHAWDFFGGAPRTWLFEMARLDVPLDPDALALARDYRAVARPFRDRDGAPWGEWALRRVPEWLFQRPVLRDLDHANRLLRVFVDEMLHREHPVMRERRVYELLDEERRELHRVSTP